jgi:hypothetical protein
MVMMRMIAMTRMGLCRLPLRGARMIIRSATMAHRFLYFLTAMIQRWTFPLWEGQGAENNHRAFFASSTPLSWVNHHP